MAARVAKVALVIGCGRVGAELARTLIEEGYTVTVLDESEQAFERLGQEWPGLFVVGHGLDLAKLEEAGIEEAECAIITTDGDNSNIVIAQVAHTKYHVPRVAVRILDPKRAEVFRGRGFEVVCPTAYAVEHLRGWLMLEED